MVVWTVWKVVWKGVLLEAEACRTTFDIHFVMVIVGCLHALDIIA